LGVLPQNPAQEPLGPALIWGMAFREGPEGVVADELDGCTGEAAEGFRWLHLNLADHRTRQWIAEAPELPGDIRELLLSPDTHQRSVVEGKAVGCVIHDFERDFEKRPTDQIGAIRIAVAPRLVVTTRLHPVRSADITRRRLRAGARPESPGAALDFLVSAICENIADVSRALQHELQATEDAFLEGRDPTSRGLMTIRRRLAQIHRLLQGMGSVFRRLERDDDLPEPLLPVMERLSQRASALDGDILSVQGQLRQLREEIDIQSEQRTNQNLYLLSIITALMLPATLITGLFGMNTGGMILQGPHGTIIATLIAAATAWASYAVLRRMGFIRR
jgi:zinc transporter